MATTGTKLVVKKPAKKTTAKKPTAPLVFEADMTKATPGAVQFKEDAPSRDVEVSGGIYLRKAAMDTVLDGASYPQRIRVTVELL